VTEKLTAALQAALRDPAVVKRFADLGAFIVAPEKQTPDGLQQHVRSEIAKWGPVIRKAGQYAD
jgi:tripartite-type tricarboxylate transporter receptor subunit TctC